MEETESVKRNRKHTREYAENFIIVWLDVRKHETRIIEQLQMISNDIEVFDNPDVCFDYITNLENEHVLLIISNPVDLCILTLVQDLLTINAVYLWFSLDDGIQEKWSQSIRKVKGVYTDMNKLIGQIRFDSRRIDHELIDFEILEKPDISLQTSRNLNKQEMQFMYSQLLKDVFLKFEDNSTSELVEYCRKVYANNPFQLNIIDEFERDYEANKAIWWYTRDSFLYKLINKALRTQHIETLYNMRTFIRHLHQQISRLCPAGDQTQSASVSSLYRGQKMAIREFEKLKNKEGRLLSISNFLSTSASRDIAFIYAGQSDDETAAIVFQLTLDLNHPTNSPFACIEQWSNFGEAEHEWLFSTGTVFRIGKIELLNHIWHIHLTLTNDQDETIEKLTVHMGKIIQIQRPNPLVPLCRLLARMDEYEKAIELCQKHASSENEWELKATLYDSLAWMRIEQDDDNLALRYHEQALTIVADHVDANDPLLASYHNNVARSCSAMNQKKRAMEHYHIAIRLELSAPQPDYTNIAYSYDSMGDTMHYCYKEYAEALSYYERALELMLVHLPATHSDIVSLYESMANTFEEQKELDKALNVLHKRADILQKNLEDNPHDLARTYKHMAKIYKKQKKFSEASVMLNKHHELEAAYPSSEDFALKLEKANLDTLFAKIFRSDNNP